MNRQLTGLLAWGALALIVAVPSAEIFLSSSTNETEPVSEARSKDAALSQTPVIDGSSEPVPAKLPAAEVTDVEVASGEAGDGPEIVPHDTALADVMTEAAEPALTQDKVISTPIRSVGGTGLAVAAKNAAGAVPPDSDSDDESTDTSDLEVAAIAGAEPIEQIMPQTRAPMTTEMTLLPDGERAAGELTEPDMAPLAPNESDVMVSADIEDSTVSQTEFGTTQIVPVPMPAYMRPTPPTRSSARYVAVTRSSGETRPAAAPVFSTQPETVYDMQPETVHNTQPRAVSRTDYDGKSRFTEDQLRSRKQRERIARQMFADNPNRSFVTFHLPNGQRETIYRYGGWDEGRYTGRQRLDTFQDGEFYRSEAASRNQFTILEGGWSRFTSSDGSFVEQLPSQRGNSVRLDLVN